MGHYSIESGKAEKMPCKVAEYFISGRMEQSVHE